MKMYFHITQFFHNLHASFVLFIPSVGVGLEVRRQQGTMIQYPESNETAFVPTTSPLQLSVMNSQSADVPAAPDPGANAQFEKRPEPMERWSGVPAKEPHSPASFSEASLALRCLESQLDIERKRIEVVSLAAKDVGAVPDTYSPVVQSKVRYATNSIIIITSQKKERNRTKPLCS